MPRSQKPIILKGGFLWDGVGEKALSHQAILVDNGVIRAIGPSNEILTADHDQVFDWPEATLLPGLVDSHTHLSMDASMENYLDHMTDSVAELSLRATAMMRRDLHAGVTTCRCLGDKEFLDVACRAAVEKGGAEGPRLLVATRGIRAPKGHGFVGYPFDGPAEIRRAIRENLERGADLTKIYISGTLKGDGQLPSYLTREEIRLAIEDSHAAGVRVASHCVGGQGLNWALELGLDTLEHAYHITDAQVKLLAQSKTALVLTPGAVLNEAVVRRLPERLIRGHLDERRQMFESMAKTVAAGIPFALGTDGLHGELVREITYAVELGARPIDALRGATIRGAKICGIENETGSLQPGKWADIVVVNGDPLRDPSAVRDVIAVMKRGVRSKGFQVTNSRG